MLVAQRRFSASASWILNPALTGLSLEQGLHSQPLVRVCGMRDSSIPSCCEALRGRLYRSGSDWLLHVGALRPWQVTHRSVPLFPSL